MIIGEPTAEGLKEDMFSIAVFNSLDLRTMDKSSNSFDGYLSLCIEFKLNYHRLTIIYRFHVRMVGEPIKSHQFAIGLKF